MDILGVSRARVGGDLLAILEIGDYHFSACFADGVQFATGWSDTSGGASRDEIRTHADVSHHALF